MTPTQALRRVSLRAAAVLLAASIGAMPVYADDDKPAETTKSQKKAVKESKTKTKTTSEGTYGPPERGAPTGY